MKAACNLVIILHSINLLRIYAYIYIKPNAYIQCIPNSQLSRDWRSGGRGDMSAIGSGYRVHATLHVLTWTICLLTMTLTFLLPNLNHVKLI